MACSVLSEKHLLCWLCGEVFRQPVSTPCGHSFCARCLSQRWSAAGSASCPRCRRLFSQRPQLSVNRILDDLCCHYRSATPPPPKHTVPDLDQLIEERLQKIQQLKSSLQLQKSSYLREVRESQKVFSALVQSMERSHKALVASMEEQQKEEEKRVETLVRELQEEVELLRGAGPDAPADEGSSQESVRKLVCPSELKDWSTVTVETDPCVGVTRQALSAVMDSVRSEVSRLSRLELKTIQKFTVEVSLSPKTAHPSLLVSEDRKQVRQTDKQQEVAEDSQRFERAANVLGAQSLAGGRSYWQVEVGGKVEWTLGVATRSVNRKAKFSLCPANGFWTLSLKAGGRYVANSAPVTPLPTERRPPRVGVFLDYGRGRLSFYCARSGAHLHTFTHAFTQPLLPFFSPGRPHAGRNAAPLAIASDCCSI